MRSLAIPILFILAGCATDQPPQPQTAPLVAICPSLRTWTPAEDAALKTALQPVPDTSPIFDMAKDWYALRRQTEACIASNH